MGKFQKKRRETGWTMKFLFVSSSGRSILVASDKTWKCTFTQKGEHYKMPSPAKSSFLPIMVEVWIIHSFSLHTVQWHAENKKTHQKQYEIDYNSLHRTCK